jgi:hypothetical protein
MSRRAQQLAAQFALTVDEFTTLIEDCSADDWRLICAAEQWPIGFVAQHVALAIRFHVGWLRQIAAGDPRLDVSRAELDQTNAHFAERFADVSREQVLRTLQRNASTARTFVAGLDDDQLARTAEVMLLGDVVVSLDQVIEQILIGHIMGHLLSIERTLSPTI